MIFFKRKILTQFLPLCLPLRKLLCFCRCCRGIPAAPEHVSHGRREQAWHSPALSRLCFHTHGTSSASAGSGSSCKGLPLCLHSTLHLGCQAVLLCQLPVAVAADPGSWRCDLFPNMAGALSGHAFPLISLICWLVFSLFW